MPFQRTSVGLRAYWAYWSSYGVLQDIVSFGADAQKLTSIGSLLSSKSSIWKKMSLGPSYGQIHRRTDERTDGPWTNNWNNPSIRRYNLDLDGREKCRARVIALNGPFSRLHSPSFPGTRVKKSIYRRRYLSFLPGKKLFICCDSSVSIDNLFFCNSRFSHLIFSFADCEW